MCIGVAADYGGFELKVYLTAALRATVYEVVDSEHMSWLQEMTIRILWCALRGRWRGVRSPGAWPSAAAGGLRCGQQGARRSGGIQRVWMDW
jgi:hypothetical protein